MVTTLVVLLATPHWHPPSGLRERTIALDRVLQAHSDTNAVIGGDAVGGMLVWKKLRSRGPGQSGGIRVNQRESAAIEKAKKVQQGSTVLILF